MDGTLKSVLFVDDDLDVLKTAEMVLGRAGYRFYAATNPAEALSRLAADPVDVILLDLNFSKQQTSGAEGLEALREMLRQDPKATVVVVTGHSGLTIAIEALRTGAKDFLMKPWSNARLLDALESAIAKGSPVAATFETPATVIGRSEAVVQLKATLDLCAPLTASILLRGEPGTGKTLAATSLHRLSGRVDFLQIEASDLSLDDLSDNPNTTVLLENIERLRPAQSAALQSWIVRAMRQNSRVISTTSQIDRELSLDRGITYALSVIDLSLPPLSERKSDIPLLADHFLRLTCLQHGLSEKSLTPAAHKKLRAVSWPDNVYALKNSIERSAILSRKVIIDEADLILPAENGLLGYRQKPTLLDTEKTEIEDALKRNNFNVTNAAADLGLTRSALYRRMSKHGL